jgi:ATP-dependent protease ClpP protease subunit
MDGSMKKILIDDSIGYDWWSDSGITPKTVESQLEGILDGEEIEIIVNSPGGSVYDGAVIFNLLRDHAKTHPTSVRINSIAMSAAGYIALAARSVSRNAKVKVTDNSVFMIHNPWSYSCGDYRDLRKDSDYLEKLAAMYGQVYSVVTQRDDQDIRNAMDEESYYVGKEIVDAGFANEYEAIVPEEDNGESPDNSISINNRDSLIINAKFAAEKALEKAQAAMKKNKSAFIGDLEKAAALARNKGAAAPPSAGTTGAGSRASEAAGTRPRIFVGKEPPATASAGGENKNSTGGSMNPEELLAKDKACYEAVFALGEKSALEKERARVSAHIKLGKETASLETAVKFIENGKSCTEDDVHAEYLALAMKKNQITSRAEDNPPDVHTQQGEGDQQAAIAKAFQQGARGKTMEGKSWEE